MVITMKEKKRAIIGILSLSFVQLAVGATSGALAGIAMAFPDASASSVTLIATLPTLTSIPINLISGKLSDRGVSLKTLAIIGLLLIIAAGVAPAWWHSNIGVILLTRGLVGVGIGLTSPIAGSMGLMLFDKKTAQRVSGYSNSMANVGASIMQFLGGALCDVDWRYTFYTYFICVVVFILCLRYLPDTRRENHLQAKGQEKLGLAIWGWCGIYFFFTVCFYPLITTVSSVILNNGYGTATQGGLCLSLFTVGGMLGSIAFPRLSLKMDRFVISLAAGLSAIGFLLLLAADSLVIIYLGAIIFGLGFGFFSPAMVIYGGGSVPQSRAPYAMSLLMASMHLGGFLSSYIVNFAAQLFGSRWDRFGFCFGLIGFLAIAVGSTIHFAPSCNEGSIEAIKEPEYK